MSQKYLANNLAFSSLYVNSKAYINFREIFFIDRILKFSTDKRLAL